MCDKFKANVIEQWPTKRQDGSGMKDVDIFVYTYHQDINSVQGLNVSSLYSTCFGDYLKVEKRENVNKIEVTLPNDHLYPNCKRVNRLYSQLKTNYLGFCILFFYLLILLGFRRETDD